MEQNHHSRSHPRFKDSKYDCNVPRKKCSHLTDWGRVTHICVRKLTIIGSDNGLSPGRRQAIICKQCSNIVNWALMSKLQLNFNRYSNIFSEENTSENVVYIIGMFENDPRNVANERAPKVICHVQSWKKQSVLTFNKNYRSYDKTRT